MTPLEYERVFLLLHRVTDTPFYVQEGDQLLLIHSCKVTLHPIQYNLYLCKWHTLIGGASLPSKYITIQYNRNLLNTKNNY